MSPLEPGKRARRDKRVLAACLALFIGSILQMVRGATNAVPSNREYVGSKSCRDCHPSFYKLWSTSFHGLAMQPFSIEFARRELTPHTNDLPAGSRTFRAHIDKGVVTEKEGDRVSSFPILHVTGGKNVFYFLTQLERGRLQVLPVAYDVRRREWFDTTLSAMRHFGDGSDAALYWKERPLTFNTSCYSCHVSQLQKNYDLATDSYKTSWTEPGINCETCHGPSGEHVRLFSTWPKDKPPPDDLKLIVTRRLSPAQRDDTCAPCHAKMSPLTEGFAPGQRYFDHFDLVTLEHRDFYADGRDLGENYTWTQWLMNPCARAGKLECLHCHTSSGRYRFTEPGKANNACLPCHAERVANSTAHTRHPSGSKGDQCISCHMPMTEFARMRRSDHSFRPPAPAATLAFGSPNACNICHTNGARWADGKVRDWHKTDYQESILAPARLLNAARTNDWTHLPAILRFLTNTNCDPVYAASLARALIPCPEPSKWPTLQQLLQHSSPLARAAAAESLATHTDASTYAMLAKAAGDDFRLVRVRAAAALAHVPPAAIPAPSQNVVSRAWAEYVASLKARPDDMASHYNLGNVHFGRGELTEAVEAFETALRLQPEVVPPRVNAALAYNSLGRNDKAESHLRTARQHEPTNAVVNLNLGMLLAELGKLSDAENAFRTALKSDPNSAQAAYNLGLLVSRTNRAEALNLCRKAAALSPEPRYSYALATMLVQDGHRAEAMATLEKLVAKAPSHPESYALLAQIYLDSERPKDAALVCKQAIANKTLPGHIREKFASYLEQLEPR